MVDAIEARVGGAHHRGHSLLRLRAPGPSPAFRARGDHCQGGGRHAFHGGRQSRDGTMDLHADQIQGFFNIPVDNIYATPILLGDLWKRNYEDLIVVSPDVGGVVRARAIAKRLDSDLAIIDKRRPKANVSDGDEHHRRRRRPHLRHHGRPGRHRQHAVQGRRPR